MRFLTPPPSRRETFQGICYLLFLICFLPGFLSIAFSLLPFEANMDGEPLFSDRFELELIPRGILLDYDRDFNKYFLKV